MEAISEFCRPGGKRGSGSYGTVYLSTVDNTVIKVLDKDDHGDFPDISYFEVDVLCRLSSDYAIKCHKIYRGSDCGYAGAAIGLKLEKCEGNVSDYVRSYTDPVKKILGPVRPYWDIKQLILTACLGVRHLHRSGCVHLDISERNMMYQLVRNNDLGRDCAIAKLIDFGLGAGVERTREELDEVHTHQIRITNTYRSPECFSNPMVYTAKADVWSLGIHILSWIKRQSPYSLYELATQPPLRPGQDETAAQDLFIASKVAAKFVSTKASATIHSYLHDSTGKPLVPAEEVGPLKSLLAGMLQYNVADRFSIEDVVDHEYFNSDPEKRTGPDGLPLNFKQYIQTTIGDNVSYNDPDRVVGKQPFTAEKYGGIRYIIGVISKCFSNKSIDISSGLMNRANAAFVCLSLDIYMRIMLACGNYISAQDIRAIALLSIRFAHLIYQSRTDFSFNKIRQEYNAVKSRMIDLETPCLILLKGVIRYHYYYTMCTSLEELAIVFSSLFLTYNEEVLRNYMVIDFEEYIRMLRSFYMPPESPTPLNSSVDTFYTLLSNVERIKEALTITEPSPKVGDEPPSKSPKLQEPKAKAKGLIALINTAKESFPGFDAIVFINGLDMYLNYANRVSHSEHDTLILAGKTSMCLAACTKFNTDKFIVEDLKTDPRGAIIWSVLATHEYHIVGKTQRLFHSLGSNIARCQLFFKEYVLGKPTLDASFECLETFNGWDWDVISKHIPEVKDEPTMSIKAFLE